MTDLEALKARLRKTWCGHSGLHDRHNINPDGPEAADAIERLEAENAAMREAITPIITKLQKQHGDAPGHHHEKPGIWDLDNGPDLAGKECEWCRQWNQARAALKG